MTLAPLTVAVVYPGQPPVLRTVDYSPTALHNLVGGWFDYLKMGDGLLCAFAESPESVEADLGLSSLPPWYQIPEPDRQPVVFMREGSEGGFSSITTADLPLINSICEVPHV